MSVSNYQGQRGFGSAHPRPRCEHVILRIMHIMLNLMLRHKRLCVQSRCDRHLMCDPHWLIGNVDDLIGKHSTPTS